MAIVDAHGLPIGLRVSTAGEHEVKQSEDTVAACFTSHLPERVIADRAYDSDGLDRCLADYGVDLIAPHRRNRKKAGPRWQEVASVEGRVPLCLTLELSSLTGTAGTQSEELRGIRTFGNNCYPRQELLLREVLESFYIDQLTFTFRFR